MTSSFQCVDVKYECAFYISKVKLPFFFLLKERMLQKRTELLMERNTGGGKNFA